MRIEDLPELEEGAKDADLSQLSETGRPVILRGFAENWPIVEAGKSGTNALVEAIREIDSGHPADVMIGQPDIGGRFFYNDDVTGFNFTRQKAQLSQLATELLRVAAMDPPPAIYAGAAPTSAHAPEFDRNHPLPPGFALEDGQSRLWLGNATQVATHFDLSPNIAIVAAGTRRFTVFPPAATANLYVGPFNITLAGQPVSMVNPLAPDLGRYPDYLKAYETAASSVLEPGDAIYIPALWWHHVVAEGTFNVLVNYWHQNAEHGGPFLAFIHALWSIRDLPPAHRDAWKPWLEHFVFAENASELSDHLPEAARLVNGPPSAQRDAAMRNFLIQVLRGS